MVISPLTIRSPTAPEVAAIVQHTLRTGDLNRSGALEYDEYATMMWQQLDFLALFTVDIAPLFPPVDVVQARMFGLGQRCERAFDPLSIAIIMNLHLKPKPNAG